MNLGNGYLSGNMLTPFPFEDGISLSWDDDEEEMQLALQRCFVDAAAHVSNPPSDGRWWPSIGDFEVGEGSLSFSVFSGDVAVRLSFSPSETAFPVMYGNAPWGTYTVVVSSEGVSDFISLCAEKGISPPSSSSSSGSGGVYLIRLCAKCVTVSHSGLTSIMVYDGVSPKETGPHFVLKGDVAILPGNNMTLTDPDDGFKSIQLDAEPGAGLGRNECICEDVAEGNDLLAGQDGHTRLFNCTSFDIEPMRDDATGLVDTLMFHGKVSSCCTCEMFEKIVNERLVVMANEVRAARTALNGYLNDYESAVRKFNERLEKVVPSDVRVSLSGFPVGSNVSPNISNKDVRGRMSRCAFTLTVRNSSFFNVTANVTNISGNAPVVEASATWSDAAGNPLTVSGDGASSVAKGYVLYPGRTLVLTFMTRKSEMVGRVSTGGYTGGASVSLSYVDKNGATHQVGTVRRSAAV